MGSKPKAAESGFLAAVRASSMKASGIKSLTAAEMSQLDAGIAEVGGNISGRRLSELVKQFFGKDVGRSAMQEYLAAWRNQHVKA